MASYSSRACAAIDPDFQGRVRLAAKEHALAVAQEDPAGPNWANRWALAQRLLQDVDPWQRVAELVVSDGTTLDSDAGPVSDEDLVTRCAAVFDLIAGSSTYTPPGH